MTPPTFEKGQFAHILWRDSNIYMQQCDQSESFEVEEIETVGMVVKDFFPKFSDSLILAADLVGEDDARRVIVIPKENILSADKMVIGK